MKLLILFKKTCKCPNKGQNHDDYDAEVNVQKMIQDYQNKLMN